MNVSVNGEQSSTGSAKQTITVIGFGRRLVATLLDGFLVLFFTSILATMVAVLIAFFAMFNPYDPLPFNGLMFLVGLIFSIVYYVGFWTKSGQTIAKSLLGIQVVGENGEPVSWGKGLLRYIGYIISAMIASIGFLWLAFDHKRQGWHDKMAGTYVISEDDYFSDASAVDFVPSDPGRSWIWLVIWIVLALVIPVALFGSLYVLGPIVAKAVGNFLVGLF